MIWVLYTAWVCPFEFGFLEKSKGALAIVDNIVNTLFLVDIIITFFVAYIDKSSCLLVDVPSKIATRYLSSWFILDMVSVIPYELIHAVLPSPFNAYGLLTIFRLWRLRRAGELFSR